ncbi:MAG: radical SAM protein [Deltaproteobacteria bacterium]|nr:radical SAM protein [Deltaproteobacteria bacterium]
MSNSPLHVLFVNPPERRVPRSNLPASIEDLRGVNPPISILYPAASAREVVGWNVSLLDAHALGLSDVEIAHEVERRQPDLVGISSTTFTYLDALATARAARAGAPRAKVVVGGVQPFIYPTETLAQPEVDMILSGEAEESLPRLLAAWRDGGFESVASAEIPGVLASGMSAEGFTPAPAVRDLDRFPMPAWDLAPIERYSSLITRLAPVGIMVTSRGCPFHCHYCALSPTGKTWRASSPERVAEEMAYAAGLGVRYLMFYDELFTVRKDRVHGICREIARKGLGIPWMARVTPGMVDETTLAEMRSAGCDLVTFGVESGDKDVLKNLGRKTGLDAVRESFAMAHKVGLRTIAYFMLGNPGESRAQIRRSLRTAVRLGPEMVHAALYVPYPATRLYDDALADGRIATDYWKEFARSPSGSFVPPLGSEVLSDAELEYELLKFYRAFSLRPGYVLDRLRSLRSWRDLRRGLSGLAVLIRGFGPSKAQSVAGTATAS